MTDSSFSPQPDQKLLWIDLEMTGLDVNKEQIIEVGAIITDWRLQPLDTYHAIISQPKELLEKMDEWNTEHHTRSGLYDKVLSEGQPADLVEEDLTLFCYNHFDPKDLIVIAGNSIYQDRKFLDKYFTKFAKHLHYRMLDVSSWKIVFQEKYNLVFKKSENHRAIEDVKESIDELRYYLEQLKIEPPPVT